MIAKGKIKSTVEDAILAELKLDGRTIGEEGEFSQEAFRIVSSYAKAKIEQIGREILEGGAEIAPYRCGGNTGCGFCPYKTICGFDERITGYEYREMEKLSENDALGKMSEEVRKWQ
jgi:ATP-dependent helicase/nuclease subunit B